MSEQDALRELVRDLVGDEADTSSAELAGLWARFEEAGLPCVGIDEDAGGSGGTLADLVVIIDTVGSLGARVPIIENSTARWISAESSSSQPPRGFVTTALVGGTEEELLAAPLTIRSVAWARDADKVVLCPDEGRPVVVSTADPAVGIERMVDLAGAPSDLVNVGTAADRVVLEYAPDPGAIRARLALLRAAALSGAVRGTYELTREYVRTREQFDAPLVKIPAVASGIATIRTKVLEVAAALQAAIPSEPEDSAQLRRSSVFAARVVAARCASESARLAHQLHGAIGTTKEYPLHRLTTALWAWRDADLPERQWARMLGQCVVTNGEETTWAEIGASAS